MVVSTVVSNLKDCAPFGSQHRADLAASDQTRWEGLYQAGVQAEASGRIAEAVQHFQDAAAIDDHYAELQFRWGRCCLALGQEELARRHFVLARDEDTLRFRADSRLNDIIRRTVEGHEQQGIWLVDSEKEFAQESPHGLPGEEVLYEHVHLNFEGNYSLALAIAGQVLKALPQEIRDRAKSEPAWLSEPECARRLAWTDWDRYRTTKRILLRLNDPPFTSQCDHAERYDRLRQKLERLLPGPRPAGLRQAAETYRQASAMAPEDWVLHRNLGDLLLKVNDLPGAEAEMRKAIELLPHDSMGHLELGLLLVQARRPAEAIVEFEHVLQANPVSIPALTSLALALNELGKRQEAIAKLQAALRLKPNSADTHLNLGAALEATGNKQAARDHYRQALQEKLSTPESLVRLGKVCMVQGWVDQGITNFSKALALNPTDATVHWYLGGALDTKGMTLEAQHHFAEAVRLDPDLAGGHLGLGIVLSRQGKDSEAAEQFSATLKLDPTLTDARLRLGISLIRQRKPGEARLQFEEVLAAQPTNSTAQKYLMMLLQEHHQ